MSTREQPGPTGRFPRGKPGPDDCGDLNLVVGWNDDGFVLLDFAMPVSWIQMTVAEARVFAAALNANADMADSELKRN